MSALGRRTASPGAALALGTLAAAIAALPDVRRVAQAGVSPGVAWVALSGSTALLLGPLLLLANAVKQARADGRGVLAGVALAAAPVGWLGQALKAHTHHRPLGAATFGCLALALVLASVFVTVRLFAWTRREPSVARRYLRGAVLVAGGASLLIVTLRALGSPRYDHEVLDLGRVLVVALLAHRALDLPRVVALARRAGALAWALFVVLGLVFALRDPIKTAVRDRAPVLAGPVAWL